MSRFESLFQQSLGIEEELNTLRDQQSEPVQISEKNFGDLSWYLHSHVDYERKIHQLSHYYIVHSRSSGKEIDYAKSSAHLDPGSHYTLLLFSEFGEPKTKTILEQNPAILLTGFNLGIAGSTPDTLGLGLYVTQYQGDKTLDKTYASDTFGQFKLRELTINYLFFLSVMLQSKGFYNLKYQAILKKMFRGNKQNATERKSMAECLGFQEESKIKEALHPRFIRDSINSAYGSKKHRRQRDETNCFIRAVTPNGSPQSTVIFEAKRKSERTL